MLQAEEISLGGVVSFSAALHKHVYDSTEPGYDLVLLLAMSDCKPDTFY